MNALNIAVVGSGISGLAAAWLLSRRHRVTLYENDPRPGGHANTVDVETSDGVIPVDTGFIVYNERNYPNLTALFDHLGVATRATEMSFSMSQEGGAYEYSGSGFGGFFGQRRNLARPAHWRMLSDLSRFFKTAEHRIRFYNPATSLGEFLEREGYSSPFIDDHIVPMGSAIWSTTADRLTAFPARSFVQFYANHGMLQFRDRPAWRTVSGGSRSYVSRLLDDMDIEVRLGSPVKRIVRRPDYALVRDEAGTERPFDQIVLATHGDQALELLGDACDDERSVLGAFRYQRNRAVLHRDSGLMPRRRRIWSSWNYLKAGDAGAGGLSVTYWMNRLQSLETRDDLFVTLNPTQEIAPAETIATFDYDHPVFDAAAWQRQPDLWSLQGTRRTWFCGSYFGFGFHEDGLQSGLAVAEMLGQTKRPWTVDNESGRINLPDQEAVAVAAE